MILPRKTVLELAKLLDDSDTPVTIDILANQARFRFGNVELVSKVVDGKFPDYNRVIPTGHGKRIELDRVDAAVGAAARGDPVQREIPRRAARPGRGPAAGSSARTASRKRPRKSCRSSYAGETLDIGFNITYLLDVLSNIGADNVHIAFGDANSSALVTLPERDDYKYVVMPMRI